MDITDSRFPIIMLHSAALALALAGCQPQHPFPRSGTDSPADAARQGAGFPADERINFQCGELAVGAIFDNGSGTVRLTHSGQRLELPEAVAASGARYADDAGNEFWARGKEEAMLTLSGEERRECVRNDRPSPWDLAADSGVTFRGTGQEPGWLVELYDDAAGPGGASLTAQLDYGQRLLEVNNLESTGDTWHGAAADGARIELTVAEVECVDTMSGQRFRASATLVVDALQYQGCGAWLVAE